MKKYYFLLSIIFSINVSAQKEDSSYVTLDSAIVTSRSIKILDIKNPFVISSITNQKIIFANRKALVIGNDKYKHVSELKNATSDAKAISNSLTGLGYKVSMHIDISEKAFKQAHPRA